MKNEGITILQIVITVVVMLILATVAILYGQGVPREAKIASVYNEIREIKNAVKEGKALSKITVTDDKLVVWGEEVADLITDTSEYSTILGGDTSGELFYLNFSSNKRLKEAFDIENISDDYILNLETMQLYKVKGVDVYNASGETTYYKSDDIENYYKATFK